MREKLTRYLIMLKHRKKKKCIWERGRINDLPKNRNENDGIVIRIVMEMGDERDRKKLGSLGV